MRKEEREAWRKYMSETAPWQDKFKAWCFRWTVIAVIVFLVVMLIVSVQSR